MTAAAEDQRLVLRVLNRDEAAFEQLVRRHQARLFTIAARLLGERELAADIVQETFLRVHRKLPDYRPTGSFSGWLARITVNLCLNELEKRKRWVLPGEDEPEPRAAGDGPEEAAVGEELRTAVRRAAARLSPQRQAVLALAVLGYSYEEMEEILGWKLSQVKSELFRARQKLREELKPR